MEKDLFSNQAENYALYRPVYPGELFTYILSFVKEKHTAWDCATGNGQSAVPLSNHFQKVYASDISKKQLEQAPRKENIEYVLSSAEETPFADGSFDLITISQAYHWLNWKKFHDEANRVAKAGCVVAVWMYDLVTTREQKLNDFIRQFYKDVTGPYWDAERKHVDNRYATVSFEFEPLPSKDFYIETHFTPEQLLGYFSTWSAVENFIKANGYSPVAELKDDLIKFWGKDESKSFYFPLILKLGRIK